MPRRRRIHRPHLLFWLLFVGSAFIYVVVIPCAAISLTANDSAFPHTPILMSYGEKVVGRATSFFVTIWFFVLGASFGSFINVVAWRIPHGETILGSSRCPRCHIDISRWDNVPVVGWLQLKGRCRQCRLPISPRYLIVEVVLGGIFATLGFLVFFCGGTHLPNGSWHPLNVSVSWENFRLESELIQIFLYHALLFTILLAIALMRWDRLRIPLRFLFFCGFVVFAVPTIWPDVHPVFWNGEFPTYGESEPTSWPMRLNTTLVGLLAGGICGTLVGAIWPVKPTVAERATVIVEIGCAAEFCGGVLGWQAVMMILALTAVARCGFSLIYLGSVKQPSVPPSVVILAITFACVVGWTHIDWMCRLTVGRNGWIPMATVLMFLAILFVLLSRFLTLKMTPPIDD